MSSRRTSSVWCHYNKKEANRAECKKCKVLISIAGGSFGNLSRHLKNKHPTIPEQRTSITPSKSTMSSRRTSIVWYHYNKKEGNRAECKYCKALISIAGGSLGNLRRHLKNKHPTIPEQRRSIIPSKVAQQANPSHIQIKLIPTQVNTQPISAQIYNPQFNLQQSAPFKKLKKDRKLIENESDRNITDALMQLFIKDFHPISIVEEEGFRNFVTKLNPAYEVPNKKYISQTLLPAMYENVCLENVRVVLRTVKSACITTECWTSSNDESFLATTVHFLDNDFYLKSFLLSCSLLEENFTSESLADELNRIVNDWDLQNKIVFSVSSGEDYIANAFKILLKWEHFGCFVHSVNKVIWDALSLKPVEELICKVRQIVSFLKNDPMASSELQLSQINCNLEPKKLKKDIPMMWNYTFYMIERFVELENAISCTVTIQESNLPIIQPDEWTVLKELTKILKSLEAITKVANQENYMLASLPIVLANGLFEICRKLERCVELADTTKLLVLKLKKGFSARFSELIENPILSVCTYLDPRFKTIPFGNKEGSVKKHLVDLVIKKMEVDNTQSKDTKGIVTQPQNIEELSVWEMFDKTAANTKLEVSVNSRAQLEVDRFIEDDLINRNCDPLEWWRIHRYNYPHLSEVVLEIFCSLATSVPCNRMFTKAGNIVMDRRSKLSACKLKQLAFLNTNDQLL